MQIGLGPELLKVAGELSTALGGVGGGAVLAGLGIFFAGVRFLIVGLK